MNGFLNAWNPSPSPLLVYLFFWIGLVVFLALLI